MGDIGFFWTYVRRLAMVCGIALMLLHVTSPHRADAQVSFVGARVIPLGYQQISSFSTAQSLTAPSGALYATIEATAAVNYRDDGTAPTASTGMPLAANTTLWYVGNLAAIQIIPQTGSATLNVLYYR